MAETARLSKAAPGSPAIAVTLLRVAILLVVLATWEALSRSGLLYRAVVPSLIALGGALADLLSHGSYYSNLAVTAGEIGAALAIGVISGLVVGIVLGANRFLARAFEPYV